VTIGLLALALGAAVAPALATPPPDGIALLVAQGPGAWELSLSWDTGPFTFSVYRSASAATITDPGNLLGQTTNHAFVDSPPPGKILFYLVTSPCTTFGPPEICDGLDNDCDGTADGAPASAACTLPNATADCVAGACAIAACAIGYDDCDLLAATGCESHLATDFSNCGSCAHLCPDEICGDPAFCAESQCLPFVGSGVVPCGGGPGVPSLSSCWSVLVATSTTASPTAPTTDAGLVADPEAGVYLAQDDLVVARRAVDGSLIWTQTLPAPVQGAPTPALLASCDAKVFVAATDGWLYRLDAELIGTDWAVDTRRATCAADTLTASPVVQVRSASNSAFQSAVADDLVFVVTHDGCGDVSRNRVIGYRASDGLVQWQFNAGHAYSMDFGAEGCALDYGSNLLFCGSSLPNERYQNTLWAIDTRTGALAWARDAGPIVASPRLANGRLYVGTLSGSLRVFDPVTGDEIWRFPVTTASIVWSPWPEFRTPSFSGLVLVVDTAGVLHAVLDTGPRGIRAWDSPPPGGGFFSSSPVVAPLLGKVFVGHSDGSVVQLGITSGAVEAIRTVGTQAVAEPLLHPRDSVSLFQGLTVAAPSGVSLAIKQFAAPFGVSTTGSLAVESAAACTADADCVSGLPSSPCALRKCLLQPGQMTGVCYLQPIPNGTSCSDGLACTTGDQCVSGVCVPTTTASCACVNVGDRACAGGQECCGAGVCSDLGNDPANCGACGTACRPEQTCVAGACRRDPTYSCPTAPGAGLLNSVSGGLVGATAVAFDPQACNAVVSVYPQLSSAGTILRVTPAGAVHPTIAPAGPPSPENGVAVSPNGNFLFGTIANEVLFDPPFTPGLHFVDPSRSVNSVPLIASHTHATVPFSTAAYDQGPVGPAFDLRRFNGTNSSPLRLYEGNWSVDGEVIRLDAAPFISGHIWTATSTPVFSTGGTRITALAYGVRPGVQPAGVLLIGYGTNLTVFCSAETNGEVSCPAGYPATLNLNSTSVYGGVRRILSLAADPLYGDVYAVVEDVSGLHQSLVVRGDDLSVRNLRDMQIDWGVSATPRTFTDERRGSLSWGRLLMIRPPTVIGNKPAFFETGTLP
jgi:outer membrane protein assembly factor BamB